MIECPNCHKIVYDKDALLCLYCGESLGRPAGFIGFLKSTKGKLVTSIIAVLIIISFFIFYIL